MPTGIIMEVLERTLVMPWAFVCIQTWHVSVGQQTVTVIQNTCLTEFSRMTNGSITKSFSVFSILEHILYIYSESSPDLFMGFVAAFYGFDINRAANRFPGQRWCWLCCFQSCAVSTVSKCLTLPVCLHCGAFQPPIWAPSPPKSSYFPLFLCFMLCLSLSLISCAGSTSPIYKYQPCLCGDVIFCALLPKNEILNRTLNRAD